MGRSDNSFSLKELLLALLAGAGALAVVYLLPFLVLLAVLGRLTDLGWLPCILLSIAGVQLLIATLDLFVDFKAWCRRKLTLRLWDERRGADL